jgi:hypothetical protein
MILVSSPRDMPWYGTVPPLVGVRDMRGCPDTAHAWRREGMANHTLSEQISGM